MCTPAERRCDLSSVPSSLRREPPLFLGWKRGRPLRSRRRLAGVETAALFSCPRGIKRAGRLHASTPPRPPTAPRRRIALRARRRSVRACGIERVLRRPWGVSTSTSRTRLAAAGPGSLPFHPCRASTTVAARTGTNRITAFRSASPTKTQITRSGPTKLSPVPRRPAPARGCR